MKPRSHGRMGTVGKCLLMAGLLLGLAFGLAILNPVSLAQGDPTAPRYTVDPFWPKPLPTTTDASGVPRHWITGSVGASCLDSRGHVITFNRAYETEGSPLGPLSVAAPPVIEYDAEGNVVHTWGDATLSVAAFAPAAFAFAISDQGTDEQKRELLPQFCGE